MSDFLRLVLVFAGLFAGLAGGGAVAQEEQPVCRLRFLAVGNTPPFRQEVRDGIRYELPPPPGSIPPRRLLLERGQTGGGWEPLGDVNLRLGRLSQAVELPATTESPLRLREESRDLAWLGFQTPGPGAFLLILRRNPGAVGWDQPAMQVVPDDLPEGTVRFINASPQPLALVFEEERIALPPGRLWTTRLPAGKPVAFQLGIPDRSGGLRRILSQSLEQGRGERTLAVLSASDRPEARRPLKVTLLREMVKKPLPPAAGAE